MATRRRLQPADVRHGHHHDRPDHPRLRHRGAEGASTSRRSSAARCSWCVGYSEPNAGSDLASLQTKCEDTGDHWLINGQKIWTSGRAVFRLVRLPGAHRLRRPRSTTASRFMLIDMHQPAIETRPIALIAGASPFCETFFTDARRREGRAAGPAQRRLDGRQAAAAARARQPDRRADGRRADRRRCRTSPSATSASTPTAASPTRTCAPA